MKPYLENVYEIFRNDLIKKNPNLKSVKQYNPHNGFSKSHLFSNINCKAFEEKFPALLIQGRYQDLQNLIGMMRIEINKWGNSNKSNKTYCNKFLDFLDGIIKNKNTQTIKAINGFYHIDGFEALVQSMGGERLFLKKAIESSYFFAGGIVNIRFNEIVNLYVKEKPIPARGQNCKGPCVKAQCGYSNCNIDPDGNRAVRDLIRDKTGYTVSAGKTSIFQNYKISHIWGRAFDPRYFTQLWNIVLIPSWANDPMDKPDPIPGSLASKMQNTFKAICIKLYGLNNFVWNRIGVNPQDILTIKDVVKGTYTVNIINSTPSTQNGNANSKKNVSAPGIISQVSVTI